MLTDRNLLESEKEIYFARDKLNFIAKSVRCVFCIKFANDNLYIFPENIYSKNNILHFLNAHHKHVYLSNDNINIFEYFNNNVKTLVGIYDLHFQNGNSEFSVFVKGIEDNQTDIEWIVDRTRIIANVTINLIDSISTMDSSLLNESNWHAYMHGISNLITAISGTAMLLGIDCSHVTFDSNGRVSVINREDAVKESVATALYLANIEKCNAINRLYYLKPNLFHDTERKELAFENPLFLVRNLIALYVYQARGRRIDIEFDKEGLYNIMPFVKIESHSYQRMFHSILSNAIKYSYHGVDSERGEIERVIRIWGKPKHDLAGKWCYVAVQNYGIGIEPDEIKLVCKPGYRGRLARGEIEVGTGMGLFDVARVVDMHGGKLGIESYKVNPNTYLTTIKVILPVHEGDI